MSERCCKNCGRACSGHYGPTGDKCTLLPYEKEVKQSPRTPEFSEDSESEIEFDEELEDSSMADGGGDRMDILSDKLSQLTVTVDTLAKIVAKSEEEKLKLGSGARAKVLDPKEPVDPSEEQSGRANTQSLARDRVLARLVYNYNDGGVSELLFAQDSINQSIRQRAIGETKKVHLIPDYVTHRRGT
jgi:hypothetical protein